MTTGSKFYTYSAEKQDFVYAMRQFLSAGSELAKYWNQGDFDADNEFGMPTTDDSKPLFPFSFDEWLTEMYAHYQNDE